MLATLSGGAMLGAPLLLLQSGPSAVASASGGGGHRRPAGAASAARLSGWQLANYDRTRSTTTTSPPVTTTTATTSPPATTTSGPPAPVTAPHVSVATTPPTAPPRAVQVAAPMPAANAAVGVATWYSQAPPGYCASPWLPFGTVLSITNPSTGARTTCTVDDREADNPGRIVDLSPWGFSQIATLGTGVVTVSVTW